MLGSERNGAVGGTGGRSRQVRCRGTAHALDFTSFGGYAANCEPIPCCPCHDRLGVCLRDAVHAAGDGRDGRRSRNPPNRDGSKNCLVSPAQLPELGLRDGVRSAECGVDLLLSERFLASHPGRRPAGSE